MKIPRIVKLGTFRRIKRSKTNIFSNDHTEMYLADKNGRIKTVLIDSESYNIVKDYTWRYSNALGYAISSVYKPGSCILIYMHRLIMNTPIKMTVHHLNEEKLDCRKCNMENINLKLHAHKNHKPNKTGYKGISKNKEGKFLLTTTMGYKRSYYTALEAAHEYDNLAVKKYGKEAITNKKLGLIK